MYLKGNLIFYMKEHYKLVYSVCCYIQLRIFFVHVVTYLYFEIIETLHLCICCIFLNDRLFFISYKWDVKSTDIYETECCHHIYIFCLLL